MSEAFVLRGVAVQSATYALARPGAPGPSVPAEPVETVMPALQVQAPTLEELLADRYQEGVRAGREAQADAVFLERQAAAEEELKQALARAAEDGYTKGWAKAREEAQVVSRQAEAQLAGQVQALEAVARSLANQAEAVLDGVEDELVGLCHEVVCRMLGEVAASPEGLRSMVRQGLQALPGRPLAIHLHPDDLAVCKAGAELADDRVRWVGDRSVTLGGAVLKGEGGNLDARLETQLRALADQLTAIRAARRS